MSAPLLTARGPASFRMKFAPGLPGPANTLEIGTVTTGAAGAAAAATITGAAPAQTLNLTIPLAAFGTTAGTAAEGNDSRIVGAAQKSANLSDLTNAATARTNIGAAASARLISAAGLATGGGDLSADRTITVTKASGAEALTGTDDTKAVTPLALATPLALKAPLASPTFTGTPAAPTPAVDTNTTQLATAAFVLAQAASATPLTDGTAAVGSSTRFARGDHVHPTDTTRVPTTRSVATGTGLTGGGDLSADRTLSLATIATGNLLANYTGSTATPAATTLTAVLDSAIGGTRGMIAVRGASTWSSLAVGSNGQTLQSNGTDPGWATTSPGTGALRYDTVQSLTDAEKLQALSNIGSALSAGQCRLVYTSTTAITLLPFNGNKIWVNGALRTIGSSGVALANTGLTAATIYFVYAYMSGSTLTLEASTTARATDTTYGHEIKSGDATRTFVGMVYTDAGTPGTFADAAAKRYVASWFSRASRDLEGFFLSGFTTSSTSDVELNSGGRAGFVCFADDVCSLTVMGSASNGTASNNNKSLVWVDGAAAGPATFAASVTANKLGNIGVQHTTKLSEGYHYVSPGVAAIDGGTSTYYIRSGGRIG